MPRSVNVVLHEVPDFLSVLRNDLSELPCFSINHYCNSFLSVTVFFSSSKVLMLNAESFKNIMLKLTIIYINLIVSFCFFQNTF